MMVSWD